MLYNESENEKGTPDEQLVRVLQNQKLLLGNLDRKLDWMIFVLMLIAALSLVHIWAFGVHVGL